jgi:DNA-binding transcriptional MerR regulator
MDKSPDAFRTISEVAEDMDLPQHVLRFWETRFPQIKPLKRGGGRRYYRPDDVELLRAVKQLLYGEGYTIKGVQKLLREQGASLVARGAVSRERAEPSPKIAGAAATDRSPAPRPAGEAGPAGQLGDVAALRAVLADLREAERLLSLARSG